MIDKYSLQDVKISCKNGFGQKFPSCGAAAAICLTNTHVRFRVSEPLILRLYNKN
jgi:hypothetical protein